MYLKPQAFRLPDDFNPFSMSIEGTDKLVARWPRWFQEFGITPDIFLSITHMEYKRCSRSFSERRKMRWSFNDKELDHNQRRRFWDELIKWQALLEKQLASRDQRNVFDRQSLKQQNACTINERGELVAMDRQSADGRSPRQPCRHAAESAAN